MRVLVAMSGGVDSSVAAALLVAEGHEVVGATLKLWGGPSDSGCCSVADVDDARRVAQQLGIAHHVFNLADDFERDVVEPYVAAHVAGRTPNPCIECNRHIKFDLLLRRSRRLGFDYLATGHHARVVPIAGAGSDGARGGSAGDAGAGSDGARGGSAGDAAAVYHQLRRGADPLKDQSYVLSMLDQDALAGIVLPVGDFTKAEVRRHATRLGLRTAAKPDSQDVCFIRGTEGRSGFLAGRMALHRGTVVDATTGEAVGEVAEVELVTVGQRRGLAGAGPRRYAVAVDVAGRRVAVADAEGAAVTEVVLDPGTFTWTGRPAAPGARMLAQVSAHGRPASCTVGVTPAGAPACLFDAPQRPVAPGQTVAFYDGHDPDAVVGAAICAGTGRWR